MLWVKRGTGADTHYFGGIYEIGFSGNLLPDEKIKDVGPDTFRINVDADPGPIMATFAWNIAAY